MKIYNRPFKSIKFWHYIIGNVLLALVILLVFFGNVFDTPQKFLLGFVWSFSICITQWLGPMIIGNQLNKHLRWIDRPVARTFVEIISLLIWSVSAFVIVQFVMMYLINGISPADAWHFIKKSIIYTFLISLFISLVFTSIGFFRAWRTSVLNEARLKSEMMAYKYESLRNQINPHFLFNSFNVLSDLVYEDQAQAVKFIRQMSELFRYVLDSRDKELVSLNEEVEFMESYTFLLKTRFGDKLSLDVNLKPDSKAYIVPMTLQMLVENAVKHNEVSEQYPLRVSIKQNGQYIEVENARKPKLVGEDSKNTGLKNISQQFGFFTDREIEVKSTDENFLVRIPIIEMS
ncbi:MAG: hypothetical protein CVU14_00510 [Bacteroidetes bacterium HGW-Bacteroidetes-9]|nr:MAG: hypothetical protein CVU14_00510 [Bacteroidetes bacterium HGW-Bacteroidetes-9]